jgi:opacity protein-like surface antigen
MSHFSARIGFALVLLALALGGRTAHAQSAPVSYWIPGWPLGFGSGLSAGQYANTYGNFPSFDASDAHFPRYTLPNGLFIGAEGGNLGLSMNGLGQSGAFGGLAYQGVQFGYNFQNSPVRIVGGLDTLKYSTGLGDPVSPFSPVSGTAGYSAHAGVEFKPTSNVSLSLGFGYTQQSSRLDTDTPSPSLSNQSQFDLVGGRH